MRTFLRSSLALLVAPLTCLAAEPQKTPVLTLDTVITEATGRVVQAELLEAIEAGASTVVVRIDSPGGEVGAGMQLMEAFRRAERRGTATVCVVEGRAASMAALLLQACTVRAMTSRSALMFHEPSTEVQGNSAELRRTAAQLDDLSREMAVFAAGRLHISVEEYLAKVHEANWWLSAGEALKLGAIDRIVTDVP